MGAGHKQGGCIPTDQPPRAATHRMPLCASASSPGWNTVRPSCV
jgi:hypothetical protein